MGAASRRGTGLVSRTMRALERMAWSGLKRNHLKREGRKILETVQAERRAKKLELRRCWTRGSKDYVAAKCPGGRHVMDNLRDETIGG